MRRAFWKRAKIPRQYSTHNQQEDDRKRGIAREKGLVFGALNDQSIGWAIAEAAHREGASLVLSNAPVARRLGTLNSLAEQTGSQVMWADATSDDDLAALYAQVKEDGPLDFIVHSIGMGVNLRKNVPYPELNYAWYQKTLDISAISLHRIVHHALEAGVLADGASIVALTYIGAQRVFSKYSKWATPRRCWKALRVRSATAGQAGHSHQHGFAEPDPHCGGIGD